MMTLDLSEKLDFNNVLIKPKRSTLESRSQVNLERTFKPKYGKEFSGIGIVSANMASGTFKMLDSLSKYKCFTAIAKHNNDQWAEHFNNDSKEDFENKLKYGFYTIGMNDNELQSLIDFSFHLNKKGYDRDDIKICVDIANGYTQKFASFISKVRKYFCYNIIVAGNVVTPEMVQELVINGADYVKVGMGPGSQCTTRLKTGVGYPQISASIECWEPNTLIKCKGGSKKIADIHEGDYVLTHTGRYKKVLSKIENKENNHLLKVNGNLSTENHKYYVLHRKYISKVTEENIEEYAEWVEAKNLSTDYLLIKQNDTNQPN